MRKLFVLLASLLVLSVSYSQKADTITSFTSTAEQLLKRGRSQKVAGWFIVGTGVPIAIASVYFLTFPKDVLSEKGKVALALGGSVVYTLFGLNFIKKGAQNKGRALQLSLSSQRILLPQLTQMNDRKQSAISLSVSF